MTDAAWSGTVTEHADWSRIVLEKMAGCACRAAEIDAYGGSTPNVTCILHRDAVMDQRWLNGLVFAGRVWRIRVPDARNRVMR